MSLFIENREGLIGITQRSKNDDKKQRKVAVEYVRLCGYSANGDRATECQNGTRLTLEEIASQLGTSYSDSMY